MIWFVVLFGGLTVFVVWKICVIVNQLYPSDRLVWARATTIGAELRPFILPVILVQYLTLAGELGIPLAAATPTVELILWWSDRHLPDDDRWQRRIQRAWKRIRQTGAGLAPLPDG